MQTNPIVWRRRAEWAEVDFQKGPTTWSPSSQTRRDRNLRPSSNCAGSTSGLCSHWWEVSEGTFSDSTKMAERFSCASQVSLLLYMVYDKPLLVNNSYVYPDWAYALGWAMMLSSVTLVPLTAAGQMWMTAGTFRKVRGCRLLRHSTRSDSKIPPEMWMVWKLACACVFQRLSVHCRTSEDLVLRRTMTETATDGHAPSTATEV